jgi:protein arginine kinase activator
LCYKNITEFSLKRTFKMLCDICKQKEATVHLTQIINGVKTKLHLCEECAAKHALEMQDPLALEDIAAQLEDDLTDEESLPAKTCPYCHTNLAQIKETLLLGCPKCYDTFKEYLIPLLSKLHKGTEHIGKIPSYLAEKNTKAANPLMLKNALKKAINSENYEQAAEIRDKIKQNRHK